MRLTPEQIEICAHVRENRGNLVIDAVPGAGKTTTLLALLDGIPQRSILLCAFNKRIAEELQTKIPKLPRTHAIHVKTFHALGLGIIKKAKPAIQVDKNATADLVKAAFAVADVRPTFPMRRAAENLVRAFKETRAFRGPISIDDTLSELIIDGEFIPDDLSDERARETRRAALVAIVESLQLDRRETIDFCDMVWLPQAIGLEPPSRYQAIVVDELQDISAPQLALLESLMVPGGRFIAAGDRRQAIYGWRGGLGDAAWAHAKANLAAERLPLTVSWRCAKRIIGEAKHLAPEIRAAPDAPDGTVSHLPLGQLPANLIRQASSEIHTYILSRTNALLLDAAMFLWRGKVPFQLNADREILGPILDVADKLDTTSPAKFLASLAKWREKEIARADHMGSTAYHDRVLEMAQILEVVVSYVPPSEVKRTVSTIIEPNPRAGILLSTVHKVKGLEADQVYLLAESFQRYRAAGFAMTEQNLRLMGSQEERNIEYVAITRAREHLVWVHMNDRDPLKILDDKAIAKITAAERGEVFERYEREAGYALEIGDDARAQACFEVAQKIGALG